MTPVPIRTPRLLIRCWETSDVHLLKDAIDTSLRDLQEWMPWAVNEPSPVDVIAQRVARMRAKFLADEDWTFAVFDPGETRVVGGAGLHARIGAGALELGYWIRTDSTGRGYATETAAALAREAFSRSGIERVEIRCDPNNVRSAAIPHHLGFTLTSVLRANAVTPQGTPRDTLVWAMTRTEFEAGALTDEIATHE